MNAIQCPFEEHFNCPPQRAPNNTSTFDRGDVTVVKLPIPDDMPKLFARAIAGATSVIDSSSDRADHMYLLLFDSDHEMKCAHCGAEWLQTIITSELELDEWHEGARLQMTSSVTRISTNPEEDPS